MLENRSFDQMLGCLQPVVSGLEGIDVTEIPPVCYNDCRSNARRYFQMAAPEHCLDPGPSHEHKDALLQINNNKMDGFVDNYSSVPGSSADHYQDIMGYYPRGSLPVMHTLAEAFLICDHWYSPLPGPTWPNRFFAHSGTCNGHVTMPSGTFHPDLPSCNQPQDTIYNRLQDKGIAWKIYHDGMPQSLVLQKLWDYADHFHDMTVFWQDVAGDAGAFPQYSFIEPCYRGAEENDQHPPADVMNGEGLVARVYNAIRGNDALWKTTLLIFVYDEHGGFFDHVPPPAAVPPDDKTAEYSFDQYGIRVPAILISPWLPAGKVSTAFDHTSILKYAIDKWGLQGLTARVASAQTFAGSFLPMLRNDNEMPKQLVVPAGSPMPEQASESVSEHEQALISFARYLDVTMSAQDPAGFLARSQQEYASLDDKVGIAEERFKAFLSRGQAPAGG
jgi:phospholipase C